MRPNAKENGQIGPPNTIRAAQGAGNRRHRAPVLREGRKSANIHAKSRFIWGIPAKIADWLHHNEVHTVIGDISFGPEGEWTKPALLQVQYHGITDAANLETWRGMSYQTVLTPPEDATGKVIYPFADALKA